MAVIEVRSLGRRKKLLEDFSVPLAPLDGGGSERTLRDVITQTVRRQVATFRDRQEANRFLRSLTEREIADAAERGKVISGSSDLEPQAVDEDAAVDNALCAFMDGIYLVAVDGQQVEDLDAVVRLEDDSRIAFIRLTLLAGG